MYFREIETPIGTLIARADDHVLHSLLFQKSGYVPIRKSDTTITEYKIDEHPVLDALQLQLREYFKEGRTEFEIPMKPQGTDFQKTVWNALLKIPYGITKTYLQQSESIGNVLAIRAVAAANGKNPIAILIPCHRIIGTDGNLTGYSGGLWRKKFLLEKEGWSAAQPSLF
ncbi:MAG: methylated-DNA--[protein]-cysteine S-methyltransferase [Bacteroidetes bacterium]|nr:methylated-DNA--[protein]-cysteine S-methyltransferase [Bacteroidota bacterium]